eukprot:1605136-Prymnesium_polylepis.1
MQPTCEAPSPPADATRVPPDAAAASSATTRTSALSPTPQSCSPTAELPAARRALLQRAPAPAHATYAKLALPTTEQATSMPLRPWTTHAQPHAAD